MWMVRFCFLLGMVAVLGCGSETRPPAEPEGDALTKEVKQALENVAETGEGLGEARGVLESLKEIDAAQADRISKDLDALEALSSPDEKKAKAKEIADKL